jgi:hypothetical protein
MSSSLFGPLWPNLPLGLPCIQYKRGMLRSHLMLSSVLRYLTSYLKITTLNYRTQFLLRRCVYCIWHGSFLHDTNDCNVFCRQIQSVINGDRLRFQVMKNDKPPAPISTLEPMRKKSWFGHVWPIKAKVKILSLVTLTRQIYHIE